MMAYWSTEIPFINQPIRTGLNKRFNQSPIKENLNQGPDLEAQLYQVLSPQYS